MAQARVIVEANGKKNDCAYSAFILGLRPLIEAGVFDNQSSFFDELIKTLHEKEIISENSWKNFKDYFLQTPSKQLQDSLSLYFREFTIEFIKKNHKKIYQETLYNGQVQPEFESFKQYKESKNPGEYQLKNLPEIKEINSDYDQDFLKISALPEDEKEAALKVWWNFHIDDFLNHLKKPGTLTSQEELRYLAEALKINFSILQAEAGAPTKIVDTSSSPGQITLINQGGGHWNVSLEGVKYKAQYVLFLLIKNVEAKHFDNATFEPIDLQHFLEKPENQHYQTALTKLQGKSAAELEELEKEYLTIIGGEDKPTVLNQINKILSDLEKPAEKKVNLDADDKASPIAGLSSQPFVSQPVTPKPESKATFSAEEKTLHQEGMTTTQPRRQGSCEATGRRARDSCGLRSKLYAALSHCGLPVCHFLQ